MNIRKIISGIVLVLSISFPLAGTGEAKKMQYKGEKWLKPNMGELYHNPKEYVHKNVYFEIDDVSASGRYSASHYYDYYGHLTPGRNFLCFYVGEEDADHNVYIWVKKHKKNILKVLYDFRDGEDKARVFARIARNKNRDYPQWGYRYFAVVQHIVKLKQEVED